MGEEKMIKRTVEMSDVPDGCSMLVEFVKDTNGKWFYIVHDEPLKSMYPGFGGIGKKTLKATIKDLYTRWGSHMDDISNIILKRDGVKR